ncbi:hypothetical protein LCGC14_2783940 [marine sediment metagenome]|uniref:Uncharacterized protein n=1 Tax=marine sediment metagenome TaxID=412755 RepID=A0A0F9BJ17_9ZZZZ
MMNKHNQKIPGLAQLLVTAKIALRALKNPDDLTREDRLSVIEDLAEAITLFDPSFAPS